MSDLGGMIADTLSWIASRQAPNGSFIGQASTDKVHFRIDAEHNNAFFTSLILLCLEEITGNEKISQAGLGFLKKQQHNLGSWNYWDRQSQMASLYPFPDDLDDTACALHAISIYQPDYVDGAQLARLAKLLIANEIQPGGPYRTWLVTPEHYKKWGDVDLAVNANIGAFLSFHGVTSPALYGYVQKRLRANDLASKYYIGDVPTIYFLSRWYKGSELKAILDSHFKDLDSKTASELAMLLTAGCRLDLPPSQLSQVCEMLINRRLRNLWPAEAFYKEVTIKGKLYYAGSSLLTSALAVEALNLYSNKKPSPVSHVIRPPKQLTIYTAAANAAQDAPLDLKKSYLEVVKATVTADKQAQITGMADIVAQSYGLKISPATKRHLNLASLNGWLAYTIYDDFFDEEAQPASLAVANYAARQMVEEFQLALPKNGSFQALVSQTLSIIDAANLWEVTNARNKPTSGMPNYGDYSKLAERSLGHMLAAVGVMVAAGHDLDSPQVLALKKFFYHYLIARQLNDDAHDWQEDLSRGHLSAVVVVLLKDSHLEQPPKLPKAIGDLQNCFWQQTIHEVVRLIRHHIMEANYHLKRSDVENGMILKGWLDKLEAATSQAAESSRQASKFISTYQNISKNKPKVN